MSCVERSATAVAGSTEKHFTFQKGSILSRYPDARQDQNLNESNKYFENVTNFKHFGKNAHKSGFYSRNALGSEIIFKENVQFVDAENFVLPHVISKHKDIQDYNFVCSFIRV